MSYLMILPRIVFGLVFIAASLDKIQHPQAFAEIVYNYRILPDILVNAAALLLPWVEAVCGIALVFGRFTRGAALILCGLMVIFLAALGFNQARGLDIACGCFSTTASEANTLMDIVRDIAILLLGTLVFFREWQGTKG